MIIYYVIWGILCVLAICELYTVDNIRLRLYARRCISLIAFMLFFIVVGFKGNVGSDYVSYQEKYYEIVDSLFYNWKSALEPGFWYWMKCLSMMGCPFVIFWFLTSFLNISIKSYIFSQITPYLAITYAIYFVGLFFERDFDGIRQGISIGLGYLAILCILKNKRKQFFLYTACACLFHYTSIVFIIVPYLRRHIRNSVIWISVIVACGLLLTGNFFINTSLLSGLGYGNIITAKLSNYAQSSQYATSVGLSIGMLFRIGILYMFIKCKNRIVISDPLYNILKNGFALAIVCSMLFGNIDIISHRLMYGFREFQIFIIPFIVSSIKNRNYKLIAIIICMMYSLWLLYRLLNSNMQQFYYYQTFYS